MACVMLHKLCIAVHDSFLPRCYIGAQQLEILKKSITRNENKQS